MNAALPDPGRIPAKIPAQNVGSLKGFRRQELGPVVAGCLGTEHQMEAAMTDPRDFDRRMDMERQAEMERTMGSTSPWGWIAGAVFIVVILALVFAGGDSTRTAREDSSPPATTGMAPRTAPPTVAVPPGQPRSTTGQSGQQN
ncbi:MAG: hypothetical protein AUI16_25470 [Alphaproteobacteria bacterium 13_2_20CM_2_64_7]|nr:MAG: hypothetical protein AUI16_25470 [Alphaproteobacteria bacterium 13_2_20CM_2_64_7]